MLRFYFILFILVLALTGYLAVMNPGSVEIAIDKQTTYVISKVGLILIATTFGALLVFVAVVAKDTTRYLLDWNVSRKEKQKAKLQDLYSRGVDALLGRKYDQADTFFRKILAMEPNDVPSLLKLGNSNLRNGNPAEAIRLHQKARNLDERNIEILFSLAADYEEAGRTDEALQTLDAILDIDTSNLTALFRKRDILQRLKKWEKVLDVQEAIVKGPLPQADKPIEQRRLVGLRYEYGRSLLEDGGKNAAEKAEKVFRQVIKADQDFIPAYLGLGEIFLANDNPGEAEELWVKAFRTTGSLIFLHRLEDFYLRQGQPEKIIKLYQEAIARSSGNPDFKFFLAKLYYRLEMLDDAVDVLNTIDTSANPIPSVHMIQGNIYQRRGKMAQAVGEFKKALEFRRKLVVPYTCSNCDYSDVEWSGRCPQCARWNTYTVNIHE